ncbi:MAG: hypothetical protein GQ540_06755 [Lutibacter sp.]|uniref:hypothetical protein n=1 Tax=Lutibacter sp. TaxID=1925666 RepID=UPI001A0E9F2E|nr:hypothetical protein [Lutibacter sp.]NOR28211.1 hypothetical protein [Lutibacter sp.]
MLKYKSLLVLWGMLLWTGFTLHAQIGIAVAKDDNGSSLKWQIAWNNGYKTEATAKQKLKDKGFKKVYTLTGGESRGHKLTSGYWVVVEAHRTNYKGIAITSFGLGASKNSFAEAEKRAVSNLSQYDWSWKKSDDFSVSKKGTF